MDSKYDVIVLGARCAGSPAAMLLARKGYRVLVADRATFPSDTISTHLIHPLGVAALRRWGLLERLVKTRCPPIHTYDFDFGPAVISGAPGTEEAPVGYCPRRTILDKLLVDAAADAGAEIREGFNVEEIVIENGRVTGIKGHSKHGPAVVEKANVVIGADGRYSMLAEAVNAERYNEKPRLMTPYYSYWSGLPMNGHFETYIRPNRGFAAVPTHDDLTLVIVGWPFAEFETIKTDIEGNYLKVLAMAPPFAERVNGAKRVAPFAGTPSPNFFRKPYGPGWALIGDAGYNKDPITAQGIMDAFHDAERCVNAFDQAFGGARSFDDSMEEYRRVRDQQAMPMYEFTTQLATLGPPPKEMLQLVGAMRGNQRAMDGFVKMNAGTISPAEFFSPESVKTILTAAQMGMHHG